MAYPTICLCAFRLKSDLPTQEFYVMNFPEEAKEVIRRITAKMDKTLIDKTALPVKSLYKGLRLVPGLIHLGNVSPKSDAFLVIQFSPIRHKKVVGNLVLLDRYRISRRTRQERESWHHSSGTTIGNELSVC
jgi:hypothetical protein